MLLSCTYQTGILVNRIIDRLELIILLSFKYSASLNNIIELLKELMFRKFINTKFKEENLCQTYVLRYVKSIKDNF